MTTVSIESLLKESRVFAPDDEFSAHAHIRSMEQYRALYEKSINEPEAFWGEMAQSLHWFAPPRDILVEDPPHARWFVGGTVTEMYMLPVDNSASTDLNNKLQQPSKSPSNGGKYTQSITFLDVNVGVKF